MTQWIINLEEDPETGDVILPLNDEILEQAGWKEGDVLEWIDNKDGSWTIRKKETKMKFTFIAEHETGEKITYESTKDFLPEVVQDFELFLRGCGFFFDGNLDFVEPETYTVSDFDAPSLDDLEQYFASTIKPADERSDHYYDANRNR